jgi:hypothetical protein
MASRRMPDAEKSTRSARPPANPVEVAAASKPPAAPVKKPAKRASPKTKTAAGTQGVVTATAVPAVSADERRALIARAAYLRGQSRGFPPGGEAEDWLAAEKEVDALLSVGYSADQ